MNNQPPSEAVEGFLLRLHYADRRRPRAIPSDPHHLESDAVLHDRILSAAARQAHMALAAALETDLLMMRLRHAGRD